MAVFNAASRRLQSCTESGIRSFDIGKDLRPVAELIADAFTNELDPRGKAALREMRIMSHVSGLLKLLTRSTGDLDDVFGGFVWVENGKIVGNVTVQRADKFGGRWQIANVAVMPAFRGRGIARRLMARALTHIEESGGRWAVLQVYDYNEVARHLYRRMGFVEVGGVSELWAPKVPAIEEPREVTHLRKFSSSNWQPLYELATNQHHAQAQWWRPLRRGDFQLTMEQQIGEWLSRRVGRNRVYRRSVQSERRFEAAMVLTAFRWRGKHKIDLWVRRDQYGQHEQDLLDWAMATLQDYPRWSIEMNLQMDHEAGLDASRQHGFRVTQTLLTMRREIRMGVADV